MAPNDLICWPLRQETGFRRHSPAQIIFKQGETDMGDKGKRDKGKREQQKKAQLNPKEKRKLKKEKKNKYMYWVLRALERKRRPDVDRRVSKRSI